ncbi:MAG: galactokinase [Treponema sp.]|nr:galactokinase [Treponema sp.]
MLDIGPVHCAEYDIDIDRLDSVTIAEAPGRIHLLGEHGEPKAGLFLSAAIDKYIRVAVSPRKDNSIRFYAADLGERKRTTLVNMKFKREDRWANYIKVGISIFAELGCPIKGLNFTIAGDIPQAIGLASSSAIEMAAATALRHFYQSNISEQEFLDKLNASHTAYFGKDGEDVNYLISSCARKDNLLIVDEASHEVKKIKSPFTRYKILIMDSRVPRMGVENELSQRLADIKKGLELLSKKKEGASFREYATSDLVESMGDLPEEIRRRSMHIVQEICRVYDAEDALKRADLQNFSRIIFHSHESLRDLYEVSCPELDWLVKRAQEIDGVLGSRMTGQGFGGCTYTILKESAIEEFKKRLEDYERIFGFHPVVYEVKLATGKRLVPA